MQSGIKIGQEKNFLLYKLSTETIAGITYKNAGNYSTADKIFSAEILQYLKLYGPLIKKRLITIHNNNANGKVIFLKEGKSLSPHKNSAEGIIFRGIGGVIYFTGGCPIVCFSDEESRLTGIIHAGWKTVGAGIIDNFLDLWKINGGRKGFATKIQILPAMCAKCLNFDIKYFSNSIAPAIKCLTTEKITAKFININKGRIELDLIGLIQFILKKRGYLLIEKPYECSCHSGKYWCYRCDDNKKEGKKHRGAAFIISAPFISPPPFAF